MISRLPAAPALALFSLFLAETASGAPPGGIAKGPWVQRVTETSASIRVEVDPPGPVSVEVGQAVAGRDAGELRTFASPEARSLHTVEVSGLEPGTRYPYTVRVKGTAKYAAFTTAPAPAPDLTFHFLAYGDNRSDDAAHAAVVRAMAGVPSDLVLHTGDFVAVGDSNAQWNRFFEIEAPILGERCLVSAIGNHELTDGKGMTYVRYFGPVEATANDAPRHLNATHRWGTTRFFLLNGVSEWKDTPDRAWLDAALAQSDEEKDITWRIAVVHHGPWSAGPHGQNLRLHKAGIPALLRAHKIDLIFSGHDHIYERGWADGLGYVVTGGGGAPTYPVKNVLPSTRKAESVRHFVDVAVSSAAIQITATRVDGTTIERCALRKETGWDCDETAADGGAPRAPAPEPPPPSRCGCRVAGAASAAISLPSGALAFALGALFARRRTRVG